VARAVEFAPLPDWQSLEVAGLAMHTRSIALDALPPGYESILFAPKVRRHAGVEEHFWSMQVRRGIYPGRHTIIAGYDYNKRRVKQLQFGRATSEELVAGYQFEAYRRPATGLPLGWQGMEAGARSGTRRDH
jgi:hypothetical protein